jgi:uncharacterized protein YpuA (DUF1002 family)
MRPKKIKLDNDPFSNVIMIVSTLKQKRISLDWPAIKDKISHGCCYWKKINQSWKSQGIVIKSLGDALLWDL